MLPLIDLKKQYQRIESRIKEEVIRVLDSGQYVMGPKVQALEERLAQYVGAKHCISCASGTDALFMSLIAKGVGKGDLIITTPFTFFATAEVIALTGAVPVFVDVEKDTFNISIESLKLAIRAIKENDSSIYPLPDKALRENAKLKGIIAVDLFGLPAEYDAINEIAELEGLFVIEDAAQSFGASYRDKKAGSLAEIACTSFFPAKPLGAYGDGGAIFCDDDELAETLRSVRVHGQGSNKYENVRLGVTGRLDAIQAAVLAVKLDIFDDEFENRQRVANYYSNGLKESGFIVPVIPGGCKSAWAQYTIIASNNDVRKQSVDRLNKAKIGNSVYYPIALHDQKAFSYLGYKSLDFPVSIFLSERVFSVPMHPYLEVAEMEQVIEVLQEGN
ncbi:DegT/DnrJ/EryC1/StrS family aminotransferase [Aestuariirhabdus haliotis]|uniref:DegT/DnrJ/EryC1/StrS family aminotransferase n=1 Tax=Aestuariirhabdus haliotis TaxID=2918751 RepID=UPI0020C104FC|nr:DegT/DnrJ/EryC1/StrS family aminotransferase [Aestuariirhabdus haliotis]MCL6419712.1 DegT/DnrJ/EryC1/StrS family aminotransferase [Aestuariirhabdus haliotis]